MKVKITKRVGVRGKTAMPGDVLDLTADEGRSLIAWGDAVAYDEPADPAPAREPERPKPKRKYRRKKKTEDAEG